MTLKRERRAEWKGWGQVRRPQSHLVDSGGYGRGPFISRDKSRSSLPGTVGDIFTKGKFIACFGADKGRTAALPVSVDSLLPSAQIDPYTKAAHFAGGTL